MIQIGQKASPTFRQPLELLSDCHRRIESFLGHLALVGERAGDALSSVEREALETALRYFREAAPRHTADEEESLFPRMRQSPDPGLQRAMELLDRLEADHEAAQPDHDALDALGREWLEKGRLSPEARAEFLERARRLQGIYERHIALEDQEVFPAAGRALSAETLQDVGREMAARRGRTL